MLSSCEGHLHPAHHVRTSTGADLGDPFLSSFLERRPPLLVIEIADGHWWSRTWTNETNDEPWWLMLDRPVSWAQRAALPRWGCDHLRMDGFLLGPWINAPWPGLEVCRWTWHTCSVSLLAARCWLHDGPLVALHLNFGAFCPVG